MVVSLIALGHKPIELNEEDNGSQKIQFVFDKEDAVKKIIDGYWNNSLLIEPTMALIKYKVNNFYLFTLQCSTWYEISEPSGRPIRSLFGCRISSRGSLGLSSLRLKKWLILEARDWMVSVQVVYVLCRRYIRSLANV